MEQMWWGSFVLLEVLNRTSVLVGRGVHFGGPSACLDVITRPTLFDCQLWTIAHCSFVLVCRVIVLLTEINGVCRILVINATATICFTTQTYATRTTFCGPSSIQGQHLLNWA